MLPYLVSFVHLLFVEIRFLKKCNEIEEKKDRDQNLCQFQETYVEKQKKKVYI